MTGVKSIPCLKYELDVLNLKAKTLFDNIYSYQKKKNKFHFPVQYSTLMAWCVIGWYTIYYKE